MDVAVCAWQLFSNWLHVIMCKEELQKFASTLHKTLSMTETKKSQEGHTNLQVASR